MDNWSSSIVNVKGLPVDTVYIDLEKAFDRVQIIILLDKLMHLVSEVTYCDDSLLISLTENKGIIFFLVNSAWRDLKAPS